MTLAHALRSATLVVCLSLLQASDALCQRGPYFARQINGFISAPLDVILTDQWGTTTHTSNGLSHFISPVTQDGVPPSDQYHFTYYPFSALGSEPPRTILVTNKFGEDEGWTLGGSITLLNPALKDAEAGEGVPPINHYKCYRVESAPTYDIPVTLQDQFQNYGDATVVNPLFWCEPAEMQVGGEIYPIQDQTAWLAVYAVADVGIVSTVFGLPIADQFGAHVVDLTGARFLYVPSQKSSAVPTETRTWSAIKAEYR